jgi:transposase
VPRKFPPEFKRDVVTVARRGDLWVNEVAADFDVSPETVRRWMRPADVDDAVKDGLTSREQSEIVQLRQTNRRLEMENEILRWAAYFAKDALPNGTVVDLYDCNGTAAQTRSPQPNGALVNPQSGKCLTDTGSGGSGTQATIDDCNGAANQRWTLP